MIPRIDIHYIPPRYQGYFDWLITGLGMLEQQGGLELAIHQSTWQRTLRSTVLGKYPWPRLMPRLYDELSPIDYWCLTGQVRVQDRVMSFAMDAADSPFTYSLALLENADLYFKCQCPARFEPEGYELNSQVRIPYHPDVFTFAKKIKPCMLGRPLAWGTNLKRNLRVLQKWETEYPDRKRTRILASFGSDRGPKPLAAGSAFPAPHNYENESSLLRRWGNAVHHPNLKRGRVISLLRSLNKPDISACVFNSSNPEIVGPRLNEQQYRVALQEAAVNVNISGFRRSLPFRFMDTFLSGGMIAADRLAIKWYAPFEAGVEVTEIGDLGYELEEKVNWPEVKNRLLNIYEQQDLCNGSAKAVRAAYHKKWAPPAFASHFVQECVTRVEELL